MASIHGLWKLDLKMLKLGVALELEVEDDALVELLESWRRRWR